MCYSSVLLQKNRVERSFFPDSRGVGRLLLLRGLTITRQPSRRGDRSILSFNKDSTGPSPLPPVATGTDERSRISSQGRPQSVRRSHPARPARLLGGGRRARRPGARRPGVGRQGPDTCRRSRQGRRRQGGQEPGRRARRSPAHARHDPGHPPDRPQGPRGAPALYRRGRGHRPRTLPVPAGRPRNLPRGGGRLHRGRHGHRGGRPLDA